MVHETVPQKLQNNNIIINTNPSVLFRDALGGSYLGWFHYKSPYKWVSLGWFHPYKYRVISRASKKRCFCPAHFVDSHDIHHPKKYPSIPSGHCRALIAIFPKEAKTATPGRRVRIAGGSDFVNHQTAKFNRWGVWSLSFLKHLLMFWWIFLGGFFKLYRNKTPKKTLFYELFPSLKRRFFRWFCPAKCVPQKYLRSESVTKSIHPGFFWIPLCPYMRPLV